MKAAYERLSPTLREYVASPAEAEAAKKSLPRKTDWPYLPNAQKPGYGQYH